MSMKYIRDTYGVPAKRGGRIVFTNGIGQKMYGVITSAPGANIKVRFDGHEYGSLLHPTWHIEYL